MEKKMKFYIHFTLLFFTAFMESAYATEISPLLPIEKHIPFVSEKFIDKTPSFLEKIDKDNVLEPISDNGDTVFHFACYHGYTKEISLLMEMENSQELVRALNHDGRTGLYFACMKGQTHMVQKLINAYPDLLWIKTPRDSTPFHVACEFGHKDTVVALINHAQKINRVQELLKMPKQGGFNSLHIACSFGQHQIALELLKWCPYPLEDKGRSLYMAYKKEHIDTVIELIKHDPKIMDITYRHKNEMFKDLMNNEKFKTFIEKPQNQYLEEKIHAILNIPSSLIKRKENPNSSILSKF
jgi:ankyrin repeat protein